MASETGPASDLFEGPGELRALCRGFDWAATPLGPVESWSPTLRIAVQIVLGSGLPHVLLWGREAIQIYNDAYAALIRAKHPESLGRGNLEVWPEVAHVNAPIYERVFRGETVTFRDALYRIERSGTIEDVHLTISYGPIRDPEGRIVGVLAGMVETTQDVAVRALQAEREQLIRDLEVERNRLSSVFQQAPAVIATLRGPEHVFEMANPAYLELVGHRELVGRTAREAFPEVEGQGFFELLDTVYTTGEPFVGNEVPIQLRVAPDRPREERFLNFVYQPLRDRTGAVEGILAHGVDVTEMVLARQQLQEQASELEAQAEELQAVASALEERTEEAEEARAEAERAREHLARVIEQAPVAMYIATGREHTFEVVNATYYAMVGKRPEEMLGRPGREVFPELASQGVFEIIEEVYDTGVPYRATAIPAAIDADGDGEPEIHYFNLVYQPLLDLRGAVYAIALVATEVTELVKAREQAEAAQREAEAANRAKADFLASMSHELRTPLNAIGGYAELLEIGIHGPVTEAQREALARVKAGQQHLLMLINDVLAFAKVEAGQIELELQPLLARELLSSVEPLVAPLAQGKGIAFSIEDCDPSLRLRGDEERVRQILLNLVGNAIKFTPPGGWVRLTCGRDSGWVEIAVEDNGPGIPPESQRTIFDPFVQVERRLSNPREGVGLGLAISRDLAHAMGGDLTVVSAPGEGSTFTLRLPAAEPAP